MTFLNHVVSFVDFDEGSGSFSGDQLKAIATSIVRDPKILFTVGTQRSGDAITTLGIFTDAGHILISHSNTNPDLTDPAEFPPPSFYARLVFNDDIQGQVMANFANLTLLATAAATIDDDSAYGIGLTTTFRSYFNGSSVAKSLATQTPSQIASDLSANPPKIIFFAGSGVANAIAVANAIKNNGAFTNTALAFGDSQFASAFFAGGTAVEGVYVSAPDLTAVADPDFYNNKFLPTYVKDFGEPPTTGFHIFAYDIIHVMAQAAEQVVCRTKGGSDRVGRQALYDQLLATTNFKGLAATYTCDSRGDCNPDPAIAIYQVQSGQFVKIQ